MNIAIQEEQVVLPMISTAVIKGEPLPEYEGKPMENPRQLKYLTTTGFRNRKSWHAAKPKLRAPRYACGTCQLAYIGKANERCQCKPMKHRSVANGQI